jgi:hypothetical protein
LSLAAGREEEDLPSATPQTNPQSHLTRRAAPRSVVAKSHAELQNAVSERVTIFGNIPNCICHHPVGQRMKNEIVDVISSF